MLRNKMQIIVNRYLLSFIYNLVLKKLYIYSKYIFSTKKTIQKNQNTF